jgi:PAS domain S-box-containing protein
MSRAQTPTSEVAELRQQNAELIDDLGRRDRIAEQHETKLASKMEQGAATDPLFRSLVDAVKDYAIFMLTPEGRVSTWNRGAQALKGYEADEIIGTHFSKFYPSADVAAGKCEHELAVASRDGRFEDEGWQVRKDGSRFWANVVLTAMKSPAGELVGFVKVTRDLTERRAAEEHRRAVEERFRLLVESVADYAIFHLDPKGNISSWNTGAERIKGYRPDEILGRHFSVFYPEADVKAGKCELELQGAAELGRFEDEGWRVRKDGSRFWANVVITALRDPSGKLVGFGKVTRDLTERKRAEEEAAARLAAERANQTKDEFLAMLGHELRNPLAPIVSALQLLKLSGSVKNVREHQIIERQVNQMVRLVDDLLDVSRISRGKIELKKKPVDLLEVLARAAEMSIPAFERKGHKFVVHAPSHPLIVSGDDARLIQVFANLLTNAGKYTPDGGQVQLTVKEVGREIEVEVRDNGIGIEPALLPRVFELFVQGYRDAENAEGGLGVGLTLVRSLVELHDGRVEARSAGRGSGSTFTVRLPLHTQAAQAEPLPAFGEAFEQSTGPRRKVLIVDDNQDARELLAELLQTLGHEVKTASDGPGALELMRRFAADVAVLDLGLPGMSGTELATQIKQRDPAGHIQLIALTGYGQPSDRLQTRAAGFDLHFVKPIDLKVLVDSIARDRRGG